MNWIALFIATTFFTGFLPGKLFGKPGAGGGLIASLVSLFFQIWFIGKESSVIIMILAVFISFLLGIITVDRAEKFILLKWGSRRRHTGEIADHDLNEANIDEVHGQLVAGLPVFLFATPEFYYQVFLLVLSFVLFRFFDVLKPFPINKVEEKLKGSWGVMGDDTAAGLISALIILVIITVLN